MFDINAKLGHWPYRPVRGIEALLRAMDAYGIERAAVSSLSAVHFLNPQDGNDELFRLVAARRDRMVPLAVINARFTGWQDDLAACRVEHGVKGVVLHPNYHGFSLDDPLLGELMSEAARGAFPVCVQVGLDDVRRQFRDARVEDVLPEAVGDFARAHPDVNIIALGLKFGQPERTGDPLPDNLFFDTSNYERMDEIEAAVERFGAEKLLFGTNFPLFMPLANVDKVRKADIAESARQAISAGNAARLLTV